VTSGERKNEKGKKWSATISRQLLTLDAAAMPLAKK